MFFSKTATSAYKCARKLLYYRKLNLVIKAETHLLVNLLRKKWRYVGGTSCPLVLMNVNDLFIKYVSISGPLTNGTRQKDQALHN